MTGVAMTEGEIRELCETFFDAYQDRRVDILERVLADDCIIWHNVFGRDTTKQDNLVASYHDSYRGQRRRTYDDRIVDTFHDGFVIRYQLRRRAEQRATGGRCGSASSAGCATARSPASTSTWTRASSPPWAGDGRRRRT